MSNSLVELTKSSFAIAFPSVSIDHRLTRLGAAEINCFFIKVPDATKLETDWRLYSNFIAIKFQNELEDDFQRWNLYVFYLLNADVSTRLKYLIENDTFSSRKIVIERQDNFDDIIQNNISNDDLSINVSQNPNQTVFTPNEILWRHLDGRTLKRKKRRSEASNDALDAIITSLKETQ